MAEGEKKQEETWGSWWGTIVSTAKEKTEKAFEMVSNDLDEFTNTMQTDTKKVVAQTAETLKSDGGTTTGDRMKQSFSCLMDGITKALTVEPEDTSPPSPTKHAQSHSGIFDRAQTRLRAVQVDTGTYVSKPSGPAGKFDDWVMTFNMDDKKGEISELLVTMVEVRSLYTTLVPSEVSHQDFWKRYFYKVHQLEVDEARKQALMKRAELSNVKEDSISWDDEEWSGDDNSPVKTKVKPSPPSKVMTEEVEQRLSNTQSDGTADTVRDNGDTSGAGDNLSEKIDSVNNSQMIPDNVCDKTETVDKTAGEGDDSNVTTSKSEPETISETNTQQDQTRDGITESADLLVSSKETATPVGEKSSESSQDKKTAMFADDKNTTLMEEKTTKSPGDNNTESPCEKSESVGNKSTESLGDSSGDVKPVNVSEDDLKMKVKGDLVVVATNRTSPSSESSGNKESSGDDWERDFDVELTEDDIKAAADLAKQMNVTAADYATISAEQEEDWENWN